MERDLKHFEGRLEKDDYSKEEVAKLLHSEAEFSTRSTKKEFEGFVSQETHNELQTQINTLTEELTPYREAKFNDAISGAMTKFNGDNSRVDDFKKLGGFTGSETQEELEAKAMEMKESKKYSFLFPNNGSGGAGATQHQEQIKKANGAITPKTGILDKLLNKNK